MLLTAGKIAEVTGGEVSGNPEVQISNVAKLEEADGTCLCFFANPKYEQALYETKAAVVFVPKGFRPTKNVGFTRVEHENPYYAFCMILTAYFDPNKHKSVVESGSFVSPSARVGQNVYIGSTSYIDDEAEIAEGCKIYPQVFIGRGSKVGKNTILYPGVKVYAGCIIGNDCIVHSGTVIGSDGFGFAPVGDIYVKIPQIGNVIIEDDVEIGSNCSIDRATMGSTIVRKGAKLDNLIQVAHNVEIGANTVIAAQTGISGSTKIGANCMVGGQVGFTGHITIADKTGIGAQSGVTKNIEEKGTNWIGSPASPIKEQFRSWAAFKNLPDALAEIRELKKELESIKHSESRK